jgi:hypothetical protein
LDPGDVISLGAEIIFTTFVFQGYDVANLGVSFASGSGDYAEWLPRLVEAEDIEAGDIVGIVAGKITKSTAGAQQVRLISTSPIVLGNAPADVEQYLYEKVALMGQVPVKVRGVVNDGDYIIPSGLADGVGIPVHPDEMTADEYVKVVGRAWSSSDQPQVKFVNIAVGLNAGDIANVVKRHETANRRLTGELASLRAEMQAMQLLDQKVARLEAAIQQLAGSGTVGNAVTNAKATTASAVNAD